MNTQHIGAAGVVGAVPTPRARDKGVRQMMAAAKAAGTLDAGAYTSLLAKLDAADASIQRGNTKAADNQLNALLNELSALSSSNISDATRASLIQAVTRLRPRA